MLSDSGGCADPLARCPRASATLLAVTFEVAEAALAGGVGRFCWYTRNMRP